MMEMLTELSTTLKDLVLFLASLFWGGFLTSSMFIRKLIWSLE